MKTALKPVDTTFDESIVRDDNQVKKGKVSLVKENKISKRAWIIVCVSVLVITAVVVGAVVGTSSKGSSDKGESTTTTTVSNVMTCDMTQMQPKEGFQMAPVDMDTTHDMMTMDSMTLDCAQDGQDPAVYMKMSSKSVTMDSGATQTVWHGAMVDGGLGFATMVQAPDGTMSGSFTTDYAAFSVMTAEDGTSQMKMTLWADFPEEAETASSNSTDVTADVDFVVDTTVTPVTMIGSVASTDTDVARKELYGPGGRFLRQSRNLQTTSVIRVLVVVTNRAICEFSGLRSGCALSNRTRTAFDGKIPVLQEQTNSAMQGVGVDARIEIADVIYLAPGYDGGPDVTTLDVIRSNSVVAGWRQDSSADLVAFITGNDRSGQNCGIAYVNSFESSTSHSCLDGFTFSHELGHNFGALHDRRNSGNFAALAYGHGYQDPRNRFRTLMAYDCPGGCQRIPYFSADGFALGGVPIGTSTEDNARLVAENAGRIASFVG